MRVNFTFDSSSDLDIAPLTDGKLDCLGLATSKEMCTVISSLDLSAAFDTVDHTICIRRLNYLYGVDGTVLQWFESFLSNRDNKVCVNDVFSVSRDGNCGVPQGSVLGARLYTKYVYPLTTIIWRHGLQYYTSADDTSKTSNVTIIMMRLMRPPPGCKIAY